MESAAPAEAPPRRTRSTLEPKPWTCLVFSAHLHSATLSFVFMLAELLPPAGQGSEEEVRAAAVAEPAWRTRVTMQRKRRHFGRHCSFSKRAAELCAPSGSSDAELPLPEPVVHCRLIDAAIQVSCRLRLFSAQACCS